MGVSPPLPSKAAQPGNAARPGSLALAVLQLSRSTIPAVMQVKLLIEGSQGIPSSPDHGGETAAARKEPVDDDGIAWGGSDEDAGYPPSDLTHQQSLHLLQEIEGKAAVEPQVQDPMIEVSLWRVSVQAPF